MGVIVERVNEKFSITVVFRKVIQRHLIAPTTEVDPNLLWWVLLVFVQGIQQVSFAFCTRHDVEADNRLVPHADQNPKAGSLPVPYDPKALLAATRC